MTGLISLDGNQLIFSSADPAFPDLKMPMIPMAIMNIQVELLFSDGNPSNNVSLFLRVKIMDANEYPLHLLMMMVKS